MTAGKNTGGRPPIANRAKVRGAQVWSRLNVDELARLDARCAEMGCTRSEAIRRWVRRLPTATVPE